MELSNISNLLKMWATTKATRPQFCYVIFLTLVIFVDKTRTFNIDTQNTITHSGTANTMFGYAVAQHTDADGQWLLIGAPKSKRFDRYISGDVFKCPVDSDGSCTPLDFHAQRDLFGFNGNHTEQMLGATVASSISSSNILACAPRFWFHLINNWKGGAMVGGCYVLTHEGTRTKYDPCVNASIVEPLDKQMMCQSGMSAVFNKNGKKIVMGATGSFGFRGRLFAQKVSQPSEIDYATRKISGVSAAYGYMGYSSAIGRFSNDNYNDYVTGAPRVNLIGQVSIYDEDLLTLGLTLHGEQMGEYFGNSLAVADFNNDGYDDVAVGAPFYSNYEFSSYDIGRVYVFYQNRKFSFDGTKSILDGPKKSRCRFGYSLASANDLNRDGYQDLIVGAPYAGENNDQGAIYVFSGSQSGLLEDYTQVIYGKDIQSSIQAFGFSISAGRDQDGNGYSDLVVGAYANDRAIYLRTRPVITPEVTMGTSNALKVDLEQKQCNDTEGNKIACFRVETCIEYSGFGAPSNINFNMTWVLDVYKDRNKRAYFLNESGQPSTLISVIPVYMAASKCVGHQVALKPDFRDKLSPISIEVTYNIKERSIRGLQPIQDVLVPKQSIVNVNIVKYCGPDEVCIPDLQITAHSSLKKLIIGKTSNIEVNILVSNDGEDSYESLVFTEFPPGISYINVQTIKSHIPITCSAAVNVNGSMVICDIGNPLPAKHMVNFTLRATVMYIPIDKESLQFNIHVNSTNAENSTDIHDNKLSMNIQLAAEATIELTGKSNPEQILYNSSSIEQKNWTDPLLTHVYEVRNIGPSNISTVEVFLYWPSEFNLNDTPEVSKTQEHWASDGDCDIIGSNKTLCNQHNPDCLLIRCVVYNLEKDDSSLIKIKSFISKETLKKEKDDNDDDIIVVTSFAEAFVTKFPYDIKNVKYTKDSAEIHTPIAATDQDTKRKQLPIWIIILAIVCGIVALVIVIAVLYKFGFFKRKIHEDMKRLTYTGEVTHSAEELNPMNQGDSEDEL